MATTFNVSGELPLANCTREDIYALLRTLVPQPELVNADALQVLGNKITAGDRLPFFRKFRKTHEDLASAALTGEIDLFSLPPGGVIHAVKIKHTTAFTGPLIATYKISVGISGLLDAYIKDFDVHAVVSPTALRVAWAPLFDNASAGLYSNVDAEIGGITITTPVADNVIGALPIGSSYNQTELTNLRNNTETLADKVRELTAAVTTLRDKTETLADDLRTLRSRIAASNAAAGGNQDVQTSIRLSATSTGANLSAADAGEVLVWVLYSVEIP